MASIPAAAAALVNGGMNYLWPPEISPIEVGI